VRPGEILFAAGDVELYHGRRTVEVDVLNTSDHPVFVSSHYPFFEVNRRLAFDRALAWGMHLDLPAGDSERFPPGESRRVRLVAYGGAGVIRGFNRLTEGAATPERLGEGLERAVARGYAHRPSDGNARP
jgi:urease beta subunit